MFCENCGTRVEDGQPFCPNCGNRMGAPEANAAPVNPGIETKADPGYVPPAAPAAKPLLSTDGLLGKYNAMAGLEKIFFPIVVGLWVLCFILTMVHTMKGYSYMQWSPMLGVLAVALITLAITFILLDYFGKFSFKWLWLFNVIAAFLVLLFFVIIWIDGYNPLSAGGWIFFILQLGLVGCSVMLLLEKMKK